MALYCEYIKRISQNAIKSRHSMYRESLLDIVITLLRKAPQTKIYLMNSTDFVCDIQRKYKATKICSLIFTFQYNSYMKLYKSIKYFFYKNFIENSH